jgi:hypothetical protein
VGPRAGLDTVAKGKIPSTCRKLNPYRPSRSLVTILTELLLHKQPTITLYIRDLKFLEKRTVCYISRVIRVAETWG